jgi:2-amino-4-hydroxy-6-hydroxymethyldihydropteridine diphosphokinase
VTDVYLGLGSNVGDRAAHLAHALARLGQEARITGLSSVYETDPVGITDQPRFLNMVARIEVDLEPEELLRLARSIEAERHRVRTVRDAPRTLDMDILLFGDRQIRQEGLTIPHPRMNERPFVLAPLLELAPDLTEPGTARSYADIFAAGGGVSGAGMVLTMPGDALLEGDREGGHG